MKCKFVIDADADPAGLPESEQAKLHWRPRFSRATGRQTLEGYFPSGTEYEGPLAFVFVNAGMALPADEECEAASVKLSPEARRQLELSYQADVAGIHDPEDRELFFAGVISGFERLPDGRLAYKPGPNYERWADAQKKINPPADDV